MTSQSAPRANAAPNPVAPDRPGLAAVWMIGAIVSFSTMAVAGREAGLTFDTFEIMTYRSAVGILIMLAVLTAMRRWNEVSRANLTLHGARNLAHFTAQNLWFYAITVIPLAQVFALEFTSPLWVIVLAALFLGERMTWLKAGVGIIGFLGVLLVVRPGAVPLSAGMLAAAAAAFGFAVTAIFTKKLTQRESILSIMLYLTAMQLGFGLICSLADGQIAWPETGQWGWLITIGVCGLAAHFCLTTALSLAPASLVMPVDFVRLPLIAIIGVLLYQEALDWAVLAGATLIFGANYLNILASQRAATRSA
ncbi:MAG: DMT family transporter [Pseudomonadota bacterium]